MLLIAATTLTACAGDSQPTASTLDGSSSPVPTGSAPAAPSGSAPAASADGPTPDISPLGFAAARRDPCVLLEPAEINAAAGTDVTGGLAMPDEARNITECIYSTTTGDVVVAAVSLEDGKESYDTNAELAPSYFGGAAEPIEVPGADSAYLVIEEELQAPVIGMLVGDRFVQVQVGVADADPAAAQQLAGLAAARIG